MPVARKGREVTKGGRIVVTSRTLDPGFETRLCHLLAQCFGRGAFPLCLCFLPCKAGTAVFARHWVVVSMSGFNICKVLRGAPSAERGLQQCWLLPESPLLGPAMISSVLISFSCPSHLTAC